MVFKQSRFSLFLKVLAIGISWMCIGTPLPRAVAEGSYSPSIKIGYAIVTPATADSAGMLVYEALEPMGEGGHMHPGALSPGMTTAAFLLVNARMNPLNELAVALANPGDTDAFVTLTLHSEDGGVIASRGMILWARRQRARFLAEMFPAGTGLPIEIPATLLISSSVPVSVTGLRFHNWSFYPIPVTNLSGPTAVPVRDPGVGGAGSVVLPYFAVGEGWNTEIYIANSGTKPLTVRVDLYEQNGAPMTVEWNGESSSSLPNLFIPSGGLVSLTPAPYGSPRVITWWR